MYKDAAVEVPSDIFPPRKDKPAYLDTMQAWVRGEGGHPVTGKGGEKFGESKKGKRYDEWVRQMNECVPAIDEGVGQLIAALKETDQYDNTLIIYTADQGFSMGHHGFRTKLAPYDANYRSPLIISMPKRFPSGQVCPTPVNATDLMATLINLMGVKAPLTVHGRDITPLLEKPSMRWPHACLYEHMGNQYGSAAVQTVRTRRKQENDQGVPLYTAVVQNGWKLIHYLDGESGEELYNLQKDPEELHNLIKDSEYLAQAQKLHQALQLDWSEP
jgi:arylsulfatase A-like enzyme